MKSIPIDEKREILYVDVTGEIYIVCDEFSNQGIAKELGKMGVQVRKTLTVSSFLKDAIIPKIFKKGETHLQRAERMAKPYLMRDIGGDALESVSDVDGVLTCESVDYEEYLMRPDGPLQYL